MTSEGIGRLHVLTDETSQQRFSHVELARLAAEAGADVVQYREKRARTTRELVDTAEAILRGLEGSGAKLIVDDRVDVAAAVGAHGVHLGRHDLDATTARRLLGRDAIIGVTANSLEEARRLAGAPADYLGVGPVYGTRSKANPAPVLGVASLERIAREIGRPVIAIGSLTPERVGEVLEAGAHGVAVLSAVVGVADPGVAVRRFREALDAARGSSTRRPA